MSGVERARVDAADYYLRAADAERARPEGSLTVASHLQKTAHRILAGEGDHHPFVQAALKLTPPVEG